MIQRRPNKWWYNDAEKHLPSFWWRATASNWTQWLPGSWLIVYSLWALYLSAQMFLQTDGYADVLKKKTEWKKAIWVTSLLINIRLVSKPTDYEHLHRWRAYDLWLLIRTLCITRKPTRPKGVEGDASARPPNLSSASCDLEVWPLTSWL